MTDYDECVESNYISKLLARIAELEVALRPFAEQLKGHYSHQTDELSIIAGHGDEDVRFKWTLGDLRRARKVLEN
mgnify:CR=1 FL=1